MIRFIEVFGPETTTPDGMTGREPLAAIDVTPENEAETLTQAKILYGPDCLYRWHECYHPEAKPCRTEVI